MAAYERRDFKGAAPATTLTAGIGTSDTSFVIATATGWPDGTNGPFFVTLDRGLAGEERIKCLSRTGTTITVVTSPSTGRGADDTTATSHALGAPAEHTLAKTDLDEANNAVKQTLGLVTTKGDLIAATGANVFGRLGAGADGLFLKTASGQATGLQWGAQSADLTLATFTTKGDIVVATGSGAVARIPVGTDNQTLIADSSQASGVRWRASCLPVSTTVATSETTTSASYVDLATSGPVVPATVGASGKVRVTVTSTLTSNSGIVAAFMGFAVSGATTVAASDAQALASTATVPVAASAVYIVSGLTAGSNTFTAKYHTNGAAIGTFANRTLIVEPL